MGNDPKPQGKNDIIGVVKTSRPKGFIYASNEAFVERGMSYDAKGLLAYLLSHGAGWEIMFTDLVNQSPSGRDAVRNMVRELTRFGYMRIEPIRGSDGRWRGNLYQVFDSPTLNPDYDPSSPCGGFVGNANEQGHRKPKSRYAGDSDKTLSLMGNVQHAEKPQAENPFTVNPYTAKPSTENPPLISNNIDQKRKLIKNEDQETKTGGGGEVLTGIRAEIYQELLTLCGDDEKIGHMHQLLDYCSEITLWPIPPVRRKSQLNDMVVNWWHPLVSLLQGVAWDVDNAKQVFHTALGMCNAANLSPSRPAGLNGTIARILRGDATAVTPSAPKQTAGATALAEFRRKTQ